MPSKKRKYNARFPAGRIKKIMQTDEEVGKVAQAVPIIISRTLELFVESLLSKAMQVTVSRNAKTLSPSHVKQCIFAESRFDFLRDLVKNIPDVSVAEEKEMLSAESSPNSSRFSDVTMQTRSKAREDSSSSSSSDVRFPPTFSQGQPTTELDHRPPRTETITSNTSKQNDTAIDLSKKPGDEPKMNYYQETLNLSDEPQTVITPNPKYGQPSTSAFGNKVDYSLPKMDYRSSNLNSLDLSAVNSTNVSPVIKIDFSNNTLMPEIKVLNPSASELVDNPSDKFRSSPLDLDSYSAGSLQIDEDYDT